MACMYSVLIPVYNSEKSLEHLVKEIIGYFTENRRSFEVILVDDCSQDESWKVIEKISSQLPSVHGLRLKKNSGQQMALYYGLAHCRGTYVVTMDDDLQHDIRDLDSLIRKADQGYDLIFGIYDAYGSSGIRFMGSKFIGAFFKTHFKNLNGNRVSSYRLIHQSVYSALPKPAYKFVYLSAALLPYAKTVGNVVVKRRKRVYGSSGYTFFKCLGIALKLHIYYGGYPLKLFREGNRDEACSDGWGGELSS